MGDSEIYVSLLMLLLFSAFALSSGDFGISTVYPAMFSAVGAMTVAIVLVGHVVGLAWREKSAASGTIAEDTDLVPIDPIFGDDDAAIEDSLIPIMLIFLVIIVVAYLAGFIIAIPFAVYLVSHYYGQQNRKHRFAMMAILLISCYIMFDVLANIPLSDGLVWRLIR